MTEIAKLETKKEKAMREKKERADEYIELFDYIYKQLRDKGYSEEQAERIAYGTEE